MKKYITAFIVSLILLFTVNSVLAQGGGNLTDRQKEAISLLNDLGIFQYVSEEDAENTVTRAEFAEIIVTAMGGDDLSAYPKRIFTDVPADNEYAPCIEYLYERGIMSGFDNAQFRPDENVTIAQAVTVAVSLMGYSDWAKEQGGYPNGYYSIAVSNNLLRGVSSKIDDEVTFADAAVILANVLESDSYLRITGYKNGYPVKEDENGKTYMGYVLGVYKYTGILEAYGDTSLYDSSSHYDSDVCIVGGEMFNTNDKDVSEYLGMKVTVYYESHKGEYRILHILIDDKNKVTEVDSEDISEQTTTRIFQYYDNNKLKKINISDDAVYIYNGKTLDIASDEDLISENGFVRLISNNGDSKYNVVIIKDFNTFIVDKAIATDSILNFRYGRGSLDLSDSGGIAVKYYEDDKEADFSNITTGSVLSVALSKNLIGDALAEIYISNNKITAVANSMDDEGVVLNDGARYEFTKEYEQRLAENEANTYKPALGSEGEFYIDYFNKLAAYKIIAASKQYGYVVKCWYDEHEGSAIRLFTSDGNFEEYELAKKITLNGVSTKREEIPDLLRQSGENNTIYQLIIYKTNSSGAVREIKTAVNKTNELYYIASDEEFVLNAHPKNDAGEPAGLRFYKNMAENRPFAFVDGQTVQFMVPTDKDNEKAYKIATKLSSTDTSVPAPVYIYDAGAAGNIGAIVTNTASEGKYSTPCIIDKVLRAVNEESEEGILLEFVGGTSVFAGKDIIYDQPVRSDSKGSNNWRSRVDYMNVTIDDLKRGDVIEYTTSNGEVEMLRVIVRVDDIGPVRIDGDNIQLNGNMIADIISVSDNGRTALVYYVDRFGNERYQTMLVNGTVYRYESSDGEVYNSSTADLRKGDRVLINSYWWSPKVVVIFR